jgi:hypothetical protein
MLSIAEAAKAAGVIWVTLGRRSSKGSPIARGLSRERLSRHATASSMEIRTGGRDRHGHPRSFLR